MGFFPEGSGEKMMDLNRGMRRICFSDDPFGIIVEDGLKLKSLYRGIGKNG